MCCQADQHFFYPTIYPPPLRRNGGPPNPFDFRSPPSPAGRNLPETPRTLWKVEMWEDLELLAWLHSCCIFHCCSQVYFLYLTSKKKKKSLNLHRPLVDFRPWKEILLVLHATPSTVFILHDLAPRQKKKLIDCCLRRQRRRPCCL